MTDQTPTQPDYRPLPPCSTCGEPLDGADCAAGSCLDCGAPIEACGHRPAGPFGARCDRPAGHQGPHGDRHEAWPQDAPPAPAQATKIDQLAAGLERLAAGLDRCACGHRRNQHTPDGVCGVSSKPGSAPARAPYVPCSCPGYAPQAAPPATHRLTWVGGSRVGDRHALLDFAEAELVPHGTGFQISPLSAAPQAPAPQAGGAGLTARELATVLAALRYWQRDPAVAQHWEYLHFEDVAPLTTDEIDELCERLNQG